MVRNLYFAPSNFFIKIGLSMALVLGVLVGALGSLLNPVGAQEMEPAHFVVQAGGAGLGATEALVFAPQSFSVHRGDTVTWAVNGFHNIRFPDGSGLAPFALVPGVDDVEVPQINPVVAFPTIDKGGTYTGGPTNSGLPAGEPGGATDAYGVFSLVIDLEPGSYNYLCDVHPAMAGIINVVGADMAIPNPVEVMITAKQEIDTVLKMGDEAVQAEAESVAGVNSAGDDGVAHVRAGGTGTGRTTVNRYFGFTTVIQAGQTVTWTLADDSPDPHTVTWPPLRGQDIAPVPQDAGPPILSFGPGFTPNVPADGVVTADGTFNSGLLFPGQSFSLTFPEAGVYPFVCNIHPGMDGVVVVQPA